MRHANAQHRATSDPSKGHAIKTGEWEARALLVDNGKAELAGRYGGRIGLYDTISSSNVGRILVGSHCGAILLKRPAGNGKRDTFGSGVIVARRRLNLFKDIGAFIKTHDVNLAILVRLERDILIFAVLHALSIDVLLLNAVVNNFLQSELDVSEGRMLTISIHIAAHLGDIDAIGVVVGRVHNRSANTINDMRIVRIS